VVLLDWLKASGLRLAVHLAGLLPLLWVLWQYWQGALFDPIQEITTLTGRVALILLFLSLACTPAATLLGFRQALRFRRTLGIYSFLYISIHFAVFTIFDYHLDLNLIVKAIFDQRYILPGFLAGVLLLLLTLTSTKGWQRRLGKSWKRLHRLAYVAAILAVTHFLWLVKDIRLPLRYAAVLSVLLILRIPWVKAAIRRARHRLTRSLGGST
jgi:sulfoxide reductase heme-binding subunit YedZ